MKRVALLVVLVVSTAACSSTHGAAKSSSPTSTMTHAGTPTTTTVGTATTTSAAAVATNIDEPTLGLPYRMEPQRSYQRGYGTVRPSIIDGGGDPTSLVVDVHWQSWGSAIAIGTGTTSYVGPNQVVADATQERATVVAFKLGTCQGRRAYDAVEWFFPQHDERFDPNSHIDACFADQRA